MCGDGETRADTSATARNATAARAGQRSGEADLTRRAKGTIPTAAKRRTTANFGVKVTEFTLGENARQLAAAPTAANTPRPLTPPKRSCGGNPRASGISTPGTATVHHWHR
jgi:hypothetical protein